MKSYRIESFGSIDGLVQADVPDPVPGRGEVLVRVRANSLNYRDLMVVTGRYRAPARPGLVPLSDGAGDVVAAGEGTGRIKPGDRVAAIFHQRWIDGPVTQDYLRANLGGTVDGMLSELVVLPEDGVVKLPASLSFEDAATLPCAAVTAWATLTGRTPVGAGSTVLVQGTGGVAVFALQLAKLMGARVIALTSSPPKAPRLTALGADAVIDTTAVPDWDKRVLELTGKRGVDLVVEVGGPGTFARSLRVTRVGGRIGVVGALSSAAPGAGPGGSLDPATLVARGISIDSITVGSRRDFEALLAAVELHRLKPVIDRVFPFAQARDAFRHFDSRQHVGKVVIAG